MAFRRKSTNNESAAIVARKYRIEGQVQGVGYRYFAEAVANRLGIRGYVKNLWDGSVEIYAVGLASSLKAFKRELADGPRAARVTGIEEREEAVRGDYHSFVVEFI